MANRSMLTIVILSLALSLTACASASREIPPAAEQVHPDWLTGTWQGSAVQVATANEPAKELEVWVKFSQGGAWTAMTGASGTSWFANDRVMLAGTSPRQSRPVRYTLKERQNADGSHELWGIADADFGAAAVSLKKAAR
ncbi:MAG TPA: hypothetical protein VID28_19060 [Methylomirabilota bacterium]|jgi:hypothetical protein